MAYAIKKFKRSTSALIHFIVFTVFVVNWQSGYAEQVRPFISSGIPDDPISFEQNGTIKGIEVEILDLVLDALGVTHKAIQTHSSPREQMDCKNGVIDMIRTESFKKTRTQFAYYPNESHMNVSWNFFIRTENIEDIKFNEFSDLSAYTIGVTEGYAYTAPFLKAIDTGLLSNIEYVVKNDLNYEKLIKGRIDVFPAPRIFAEYRFKKMNVGNLITYLPRPFKEKPYYNIFCKKSDHPKMDFIMENYDQKLIMLKKQGLIDKVLKSYGL